MRKNWTFVFVFFLFTISGCKDNSTEPKEEITSSPWNGDWVYYSTSMVTPLHDGSYFWLTGFRIENENKINWLGLNTKTGFADIMSDGADLIFTPNTDTTATLLIKATDSGGMLYEVSRNPLAKTITIENYHPLFPNVFSFSPKEKKYSIPPASGFSFKFLNKDWSFPVVRNISIASGTSIDSDTLYFFFSIGNELNETGRLVFNIIGYKGSGTYQVFKNDLMLIYYSNRSQNIYTLESEQYSSVTLVETVRDGFIFDLKGSFQFTLKDSGGALVPLTNGTFKSSYIRH